ncbi:MAG: flavodoxin family protein [Lachnospiraceae bacterium]|nr:flavodoxin family protein [Lachnospiraceae bacterium]
MKVIGINGSPRKGWNSDILLDNALEGAAAAGAEVKKYNLFDLKYTGCLSCFACKRIDGPEYRRCALKDDLKPVIDDIMDADALIVSLPIYYGDAPGAVRNLYERLWFPPNIYSKEGKVASPMKTKVGLIYTMGAPDPKFNGNLAEKDKAIFERFFGPTEVLNVTDTYQFTDYSKYTSSMFNPEAKKKRREEVFPADCKKAYEMGERLAR